MNVMKYLVTGLSVILLSACASASQPETPLLQPSDDLRPYAQSLSRQLIQTGSHIRGGQRVAVTTPAWLESNLDSSSLLALQLQESLMAELHNEYLHVVEYKMTDGIRVTAHGDFPLTRNYLELQELQSADYILAATAVEKAAGITINARLIEFNSQIVAATAEVTIPRVLVNQFRSEQGIELVGR